MAQKFNALAHRREQYEAFGNGECNFDDFSDAVRDWAITLGFEDDLTKLHEIIDDAEAGEGRSITSEQDRAYMHTMLETIFSLAQVGLITSELGELVEAIRKPTRDDHLPEHDAATAEMSDTLIRVAHLNSRLRAHAANDVQRDTTCSVNQCTRAKMNYNESRPYKHGKNA